jgi:hypothetical protein
MQSDKTFCAVSRATRHLLVFAASDESVTEPEWTDAGATWAMTRPERDWPRFNRVFESWCWRKLPHRVCRAWIRGVFNCLSALLWWDVETYGTVVLWSFYVRQILSKILLCGSTFDTWIEWEFDAAPFYLLSFMEIQMEWRCWKRYWSHATVSLQALFWL